MNRIRSLPSPSQSHSQVAADRVPTRPTRSRPARTLFTTRLQQALPVQPHRRGTGRTGTPPRRARRASRRGCNSSSGQRLLPRRERATTQSNASTCINDYGNESCADMNGWGHAARAAATSAVDLERRTRARLPYAPRPSTSPRRLPCSVASLAPSSSLALSATAALAQSAPKLDLPRPSPKGSVTPDRRPHRHLGRLLEPCGEGPEDLGWSGALRPGLARRGQRVHQGDLLDAGLHRGQASRRRARYCIFLLPQKIRLDVHPQQEHRAGGVGRLQAERGRPPRPGHRHHHPAAASVWPSTSSTSTTRRGRWRWSGRPSGWE